MGTVKCIKLQKYLLLLVFLTGSFLHAQSEAGSGSFVINTDQGFTVFQIISFPAVPNALRYEVEIEELTRTGIVPIETITSEINRIELSLRAGSYRYRITAYNRMGLLEGRSGWQDFTIYPAIQPIAEAYEPAYGLLSVRTNPTGSITVTGRDFFPESEFALVMHNPNFDWTGVILEERRDVIIPDQVIIYENQAELTFERRTLRRGTYDVFIRNPGGLWTTLGPVQVANVIKTEFLLSIGWSPMIPLFGIERHDDGWFDTGSSIEYMLYETIGVFNPLGANISLAVFPFVWKNNKIGFGIDFAILEHKDRTKVDYYYDGEDDFLIKLSILSHLLFGVYYQREFGESWQMGINFGMGISHPYDYLGDVDGAVFAMNTDMSIQYFFHKNYFVGFQLNTVFIFNHYMESDNRLTSAVLRPSLNIGVQLNRRNEINRQYAGIEH